MYGEIECTAEHTATAYFEAEPHKSLELRQCAKYLNVPARVSLNPFSTR
jgi:hypothetical protein